MFLLAKLRIICELCKQSYKKSDCLCTKKRKPPLVSLEKVYLFNQIVTSKTPWKKKEAGRFALPPISYNGVQPLITFNFLASACTACSLVQLLLIELLLFNFFWFHNLYTFLVINVGRVAPARDSSILQVVCR